MENEHCKIYIIRFKKRKLPFFKVTHKSSSVYISKSIESEDIIQLINCFCENNSITIRKMVVKDSKHYSFIKIYGTHKQYLKLYRFLSTTLMRDLIILK